MEQDVKEMEEYMRTCTVFKGENTLYPRDLFDYKGENNFSCFIDLKRARENNDWYKYLKRMFYVKNDLQFESIVFSVNPEDLGNEKTVKLIHEIIDNKIKEHCKNLKLISVGRMGESGVNNHEDMLFYYNDETKKAMKDISILFPDQKIFLLDLQSGSFDDVVQASTIDGIRNSNLMVEDTKIDLARQKIRDIAEMIKSKTTSQYRQHLLTLHYITQYVYTLDDENKSYLSSRSLSEILNTDAEYICCAGFARIYVEIMRELGNEVQIQIADRHLRAKVLIQDDECGIHGVYLVDPTWLSRKPTDEFPNFRFNKLANMSVKTIYERYSTSRVSDFAGMGALRSYVRQMAEFETLKEDLSNNNLNSQDIYAYLIGEYTEKRDDLYYDVAKDLKQYYKEHESIKDLDLSSYLDKFKPKKLDEKLIEYLKRPANERKHNMATFLKKVKKEFEEQPFDDAEEMLEFLREKACENGIIKEIADIAFKETEYLYSYVGTLPNYDYAFYQKKVKKVLFKMISKEAINIAERGLIIEGSKITELRNKNSKDIEVLTGRKNFDRIPIEDLEGMKKNFTSLPDKTFNSIFQETTEIDYKKLSSEVENIKKLIKPEDYKLFNQKISHNSHKSQHEDRAMG